MICLRSIHADSHSSKQAIYLWTCLYVISIDHSQRIYTYAETMMKGIGVLIVRYVGTKAEFGIGFGLGSARF